PLMGSEDFGTLAQSIDVPSVYWFFGAYPEETLNRSPVPMNHSPFFPPALEPTLSTAVHAAVAATMARLGK
ncbi:amidohydrolase, partial [Arthrobacter deserti]|nr:amidohydrolase [Arthrobacter deserti]